MRVKELKQRGDELLQDAKESDQDLNGNLTFYSTLFNQVGQKAQLLTFFFFLSSKDAADGLTNAKRRLSEADKKKKALQSDLLDAQNQLSGIKTGIVEQFGISLAG